ncbi:MAG: hypothetical protein FJ279_23400 [Planctomycetes bacterium]|nr:hypothetical protein [Planctomycetota bacterium]
MRAYPLRPPSSAAYHLAWRTRPARITRTIRRFLARCRPEAAEDGGWSRETAILLRLSEETDVQPSDTHPEAERVQVELLRQASVQTRLSLALSLSETAMSLSRRAIRRARPGISEQEVGLAFVELHYGRELAERVREYVNRVEP